MKHEDTFSKKVNKEQGRVYTPLFIVDYILDNVLINANTTIIDPSCGTGIFLIESLKRFGKPFKKAVEENIFGIDIDAQSVEITKQTLSDYVIQQGEECPKKFNIFVGDATNRKFLDGLGKFDAVVGNPPYVRIQNIPDKTFLKDWKYATGDSDLYVVFIELGLSLLNDDGVLGYITPSSYLKNKSTEKLVKYLINNKRIETIVDFEGMQVFGKKALTYTSILVVKNKTENIRICKLRSKLDLKDMEVDCKNWKDVSMKNILIHSSKIDFFNKMENVGVPLKELVKIRVGLATLADRIFLVDDPSGFEIESLKPCIKVSRFKKQYIIFPYKGNVPYTEEEMWDLFPKTTAYLYKHKNILINRDKGKNNLPWWLYGRTQGLTNLFGIKLLMPSMMFRPKFMLCEQEDSLYISGYGIFGDNLPIIKMVLESDLFYKYIQLTGKDYQGCWKSCTKHGIERFSIPYIAPDEIEELKNDTNRFLEKKYLI